MSRFIIFIHGLSGNPEETWGQFPALVKSDPDLDYEIKSFGYTSPNIIKGMFTRAPSIYNIANGVLTDIDHSVDMERDDVILVGHSLGGIVIKRIMIRLFDANRTHNIRKICFFDTPHDGSGFANVGKYINLWNRHLKGLCRDSSELDELNDEWVAKGISDSVNVLSVICANDGVVSSLSSKSIYRSYQVETINNVDHRTIVKPKSYSDLSFIVLKRFLLKENTVGLFKDQISRDLNDWERVDRNHAYGFVLDKKRSADQKSLENSILDAPSAVRLVGASGMGKTRLLLEVLKSKHDSKGDDVIIYEAPRYEKEILIRVKEMIRARVSGVVIVEKCPVSLHCDLVSELNSIDFPLSLITMGTSREKSEGSIYIELSPLSDSAIVELLKPILRDLDDGDLERVSKFTQGNPLMATLIAQQYNDAGRLLGSISDRTIVSRLIDGDEKATDIERNILSACSLFDVFGTEGSAEVVEAKFIAESIVGSTMREFENVLSRFSSKQIVERVGGNARIVPKPLAVTLAAEWWNIASNERKRELIDNIPRSLIESFCTQIGYLDHLPSVKKFSDELFEGPGPFVLAEELLTERGSRLFRGLVVVNRHATSRSLCRILSQMNHDEVLEVGSVVRRNLVWGLEKLCYHDDVFEDSAWCMLILAASEVENFSNNATGMFCQLFGVYLSGTSAKPDKRFALIDNAMGLNRTDVDLVIVKALRRAIDMFGHSRMIGAEYQGTSTKLKEWQPTSGEEIIDYWRRSLDFLTRMIDRGEDQRLEAMSAIGNSIRGFCAQNQYELVDGVLKTVIEKGGQFWPSALGSIRDTLQYDSKSLNDKAEGYLQEWLSLLDASNADLEDKIKILVVDPPWEHIEEEDGSFTDVAEVRVRGLAEEVAGKLNSLVPCYDLLLVGEVKKAYTFGREIGVSDPDAIDFLRDLFTYLGDLKNYNLSFVYGLCSGIFKRTPKVWNEFVERVEKDERLIFLYPEFIRTGEIREIHLGKLLEFVKTGKVEPQRVAVLSYGQVLHGLKSEVVGGFCTRLAEIGGVASWVSLNNLFMYCFKDENRIFELRETLSKVCTSVPLQEVVRGGGRDVYQWAKMSESLLNLEVAGFPILLAKQLVSACEEGYDYSELWNYIKPLLVKLAALKGRDIWGVFEDAIIQSEGKKRYWLKELLERETSESKRLPSALSMFPHDKVLEMCGSHLFVAPEFVAECIDIVSQEGDVRKPSELFVKLLERFGNLSDVRNALFGNLSARSWSGSLIPHLKTDREAVAPLIEHPSSNVRRWAKEYLKRVDRSIKNEEKRESNERKSIR